MTDALAPDIFGSSIFCDDIRFEQDGKVSYIGAYAGTMFVRGAFPCTLPKFAIAFQFVQLRELFIKEIRLKIFLPGDADDKPSISSDLMDLASAPTPTAPETRYVIIGGNMIFTPMVINSPGHLKVRIEREGVLHGLGTLRITASPGDNSLFVLPPTAAVPSSSQSA